MHLVASLKAWLALKLPRRDRSRPTRTASSDTPPERRSDPSAATPGRLARWAAISVERRLRVLSVALAVSLAGLSITAMLALRQADRPSLSPR